MSLTADIAGFLSDLSYGQIPEAVRARAKLLILDTLGVMLAGAEAPSSLALRASGVLPATPDGQQVAGTSLRAPAPLAALANGVSAHALDYDDTSFVLVAHTSGSAVPALLALGELQHATGRQMLAAFVAGYEATTRLAAAIMPALYVRGWHTTGTLGALCAAACGAHLAGLDPAGNSNALGIAASMAGGLRANFGSFTKALHTGSAAQTGVEATLLAQAGFTASEGVLEHHYGFYAVLTGPENVSLEKTEAALADRERWSLIDPGIGIKLYPCNSAVLPGIETTLELVEHYQITPDQVESVDYRHTDLARTIVPFDEPQNSPEAMYSMTHAIAAPIVYRKAGIAEFAEPAVHDPAVDAVRRRIRPVQHPDFTAVTDPHDVPASEVTIHLKDGRSVSGFRRRPRGYPGGAPLTRDDVLAKFRDCAQTRLSPDRCEELAHLVDRLEELSDISILAQALRAAI